jgi:hypothetical protein
MFQIATAGSPLLAYCQLPPAFVDSKSPISVAAQMVSGVWGRTRRSYTATSGKPFVLTVPAPKPLMSVHVCPRSVVRSTFGFCANEKSTKAVESSVGCVESPEMPPSEVTAYTGVAVNERPWSVETWIFPLPSIRAPPQTMFGLAREMRISWNELMEPHVVPEMAVRFQLAPKFVERNTPEEPTAKRRSGAMFVLAIFVMKGADPEPVLVSPLVALDQVAPPSVERWRPLYCEPPMSRSGSLKCQEAS